MYKINLNEYELNILNAKIENNEVRKKIMSLYTYLIKHSESNMLTISAAKLHSKYIRYHVNYSLSYFKKLIARLKDIGLIKIIKNGKTNTYNILRVAEKVSEIVSNNETSLSIAESATEANFNLPKCKLKNNNIDIDIYTNKNYVEQINKEKKCKSLVDVRKRVKELIQETKIKSTWIKNYVLIICTKFYKNITVNHLDSYILKVINTARIKYYNNYNSYKTNTKQLKTRNFTERNYNTNQLEELLLNHYQN